MRGKKIILLVLILLLLCLTGAAYAYGVTYFNNHFLPGSTVNGYNCSYMTTEETEALMNREANAYALAVEYQGNGREGITAQEVGLTYSSDGSVQQMIHDQNRFTWFLEFTKDHPHDLSRSLSYQQEAFDAAVSGLKCADPATSVPPQDAGIAMDEDGVFYIVPEVDGSMVDMDRLREVISQAMVSGTVRVDLEEEGCYQRPSVYADDPLLIQNCERMNDLTDIIITLDFGRRTERVDHDVIMTWFGTDENGALILDYPLVREYASRLAEKYDSIGGDRTFRTYDGRTITVTGGDFGWVLNVDGETADLIDAVESGVTQVRQPVYTRGGYDRNSSSDIGYTYIEIDIAHQKLVYYENGIPVLETSCVTGYGTPTGVFCAGNAEMFKEINGGFMQIYNPEAFAGEFATPLDISSVRIENGLLTGATVTYWMPFDGVAITEGVARNIFGVEGYNRAPTTGNVEVATADAAVLFGKFVPNLPVVVY